jgi:putative ABC transport system permease protein
MKKKIIHSSIKVLTRYKLQTFFMILGIVIGVFALSLTFSMGKGTEKQIMTKVKSFFASDNILIGAGKSMQMGGPRSEGPVTSLKMDDLEAIINEVPGVLSYDPIQQLPETEIIYNDKNITAMVVGRSSEGEAIWQRSVTSGEYFTKEDEKNVARVALVGSNLAKRLFGDSNPIGAEIRIGSVPFIVKGILEKKGIDPHGIDLDMQVIVPITTMMKRCMNVDYVSGAKLEVDETKMKEIAENISVLLRQRHALNKDEANDFIVVTPIQVQEMIKKMNKIFTFYLPLISGVILLIGGIIIIILMLISVSRRVSEIGLRKAVGASQKHIMYQFLAESLVISLLGGIIGLIIGILGTWYFFVSRGFDFYITWQTIVFGLLIPVIIGIFAGFIPARKAARLDPVKALS